MRALCCLALLLLAVAVFAQNAPVLIKPLYLSLINQSPLW